LAELRRAASVLAYCEPGRVLWARRSDASPAIGGFHVAPGGALEACDANAPHDGGDDAPIRVCALRELFEEVGILRAHGALDHDEQIALRDLYREDAAGGHARFAALGMRWRTSELEPLGRWVAPPHAPARFDMHFFALRLDRAIDPDPDLFELDEAEWIDARAALARWSRAEVMLAPSLASILRAIDREGALVARRTDSIESLLWEVVPDVRMAPFRTPTLPPATHTNSYLVGARRAIVIEPATPYAEEIDRAVRWVEEARSIGITPIAIALTHHHIDHVGGARVLSERLALPLWAHAETIARLRGDLSFERALEDGERIELDGAVLRAVHTPGHAPGHLCFFEERSGAMIAGDMVAGEGTILVEPGDGDMALYLDSLARMASLQPTVLLPAHGPPLRDAKATLARYTAHRLAREEKVLEALALHGEASAADLLATAYADTPRAAWPLAIRSIEAHLIKLERDGRVRRLSQRWEAVRAS
jgi:endoribonuclease LACTB2